MGQMIQKWNIDDVINPLNVIVEGKEMRNTQRLLWLPREIKALFPLTRIELEFSCFGQSRSARKADG